MSTPSVVERRISTCSLVQSTSKTTTAEMLQERLRFVAVVGGRVEVERLLAHERVFGDPLPIHRARTPEHEETLDFP